jgi:hypothetical protein
MLARAIAAILCGFVLAAAASPPDDASRIASLINRSKLATLGVRAANPRVQIATLRKRPSIPDLRMSPEIKRIYPVVSPG